MIPQRKYNNTAATDEMKTIIRNGNMFKKKYNLLKQ